MENYKSHVIKAMLLLLFVAMTNGMNAQGHNTSFVKDVNTYVNVDLDFWSPYSMSTYEEGLSTSSSFFSANFEGEIVYHKSRKNDDAICYSLGFSGSVFKSEYNNPFYDFSSTADVDGDEYIREYRNLYLNQSASVRAFSMSISARHKFHLCKSIDLYGDLGVRAEMFAKGTLDLSEGSADVYGLYRQYDNLCLGEEWKNNGFGHVDFKYADKVNPGVNKFVPIAFARLGVMWKFTSRFSLGVGGVYSHAFNSSLMYTGNGKINENDAIVHNTINENGGSFEHVKSVLGMYHRSRLNSLGLNVSIKYFIFDNE